MKNHTISVLSILIQDLPAGTNLALLHFCECWSAERSCRAGGQLPGAEINRIR